MKKCRIVKRVSPDHYTTYTIQQRHLFFRWWWVDAWVNSGMPTDCVDSFFTLEEAMSNLWRFDGSKGKEEVVREFS